MSSKEASELARQYAGAGYTVEHAGNGHMRVLDSDGRFVTSFASTPSTARSARVDRIRFGQVIAGKPILGRRTPREVPQQAVAPEAVPDIPAAFRRADRRAQDAELAAREADVIGRAGSLAGINDIGDLFASVAPVPGVMDRLMFAEKFDIHRRGRAKRRQQARASAGERKIVNLLRSRDWEPGLGSGTCIACITPCDTMFAPSFDSAEGHIAFLLHLGMSEDQAYGTFRVCWNEHHPMFRIDEGKIPEDYVICGVQIPTRVCQDCFDNFQKVAFGGRHVRLRDYPQEGTDQNGRKLFGIAYEFDYCEDGPEFYERNKAVAHAAMRLEAAVVDARETGEDVAIREDDTQLLASIGFRFPPELLPEA